MGIFVSVTGTFVSVTGTFVSENPRRPSASSILSRGALGTRGALPLVENGSLATGSGYLGQDHHQSHTMRFGCGPPSHAGGTGPLSLSHA